MNTHRVISPSRTRPQKATLSVFQNWLRNGHAGLFTAMKRHGLFDIHNGDPPHNSPTHHFTDKGISILSSSRLASLSHLLYIYVGSPPFFYVNHSQSPPFSRVSRFVFPTMPKDSTFHTCIAALLLIQTLCWALTLLDLLSPGKPLALLRTWTDVMSQLLSRRPSSLLSYKDIRIRI
jgi:hypothetical protein